MGQVVFFGLVLATPCLRPLLPTIVEAKHYRFGVNMLYYAFVFLVLAVVAGVFGFGGVAGAATSMAQILFVIFLVALAVSVIANAVRGKRLI